MASARRIAIEYVLVMFFSVLVALAYQYIAGASFLGALVVGLALTIIAGALSAGRRGALSAVTIVLLVITWVVLLILFLL